jgi:hypothetical protein
VDEERKGLFIGKGTLRIGQEIAGVYAVVGLYCGEILARNFSAVETKMTWPGQQAPPIIEKERGKRYHFGCVSGWALGRFSAWAERLPLGLFLFF